MWVGRHGRLCTQHLPLLQRDVVLHPTPFPDDFYIDKQWFTWKDAWQQDTVCPYVETYPGGGSLPSDLQVVRDAADGMIGVWPYTTLVDWVWRVALEPQ